MAIRQFKLWNGNITASFNLSAGNVIVGNVSGLGHENENEYVQNGSIKHLTKSLTKYPAISLEIHFLANAYHNYNLLLNFISTHKKNGLILEYTVNNRTIYSSVMIVNAPKSQKNEYGIIQETFTFDRNTPWYEMVTIDNIAENPATIVNSYYEDISIKIEILTASANHLITASINSVIVQTIKLLQTISSGQKMTIDGESAKVIYDDGESTINGYLLLDHGAAFDTFIEVPANTTAVIATTASNIKITYKRWVID